MIISEMSKVTFDSANMFCTLVVRKFPNAGQDLTVEQLLGTFLIFCFLILVWKELLAEDIALHSLLRTVLIRSKEVE